MTFTDLAGKWTLSNNSGDYTCNMHLPGDGITALHDAGLVPDPYWGRNEYDLRWIAARDRTATLSYVNVGLALSMVDCVATVCVTGITVLETKNSFRDYLVPLGEVARVGNNEINVTFHSPVKAAQDAHPFFLAWQEGNSPIPNDNLLRKVQCDFG